MQASFAPIAKQLDKALTEAKTRLQDEGVEIRDRSNRSGFDKSGYGVPSWSFEFERRCEGGRFIGRIAAQVRYEESLFQGKPGQLEATWTSEVFQPASLSAIKNQESSPLSISSVSPATFLDLIREMLQKAEAALPQWFVASRDA